MQLPNLQDLLDQSLNLLITLQLGHAGSSRAMRTQLKMCSSVHPGNFMNLVRLFESSNQSVCVWGGVLGLYILTLLSISKILIDISF